VRPEARARSRAGRGRGAVGGTVGAAIRGAIAVWLALSSPAVAQDGPGPPAGPDGPGMPAGPDGPDTLRESYRDWVLSCAPGPPAEAETAPARRCEIAQEIGTAGTGQRVLRMALVPGDTADGTATVALVTPFGVRVADGVGIAAGSGAAAAQARVDFLTCLQGGCVATGTLDAAMLDALQAAGTATVTMNATGGDTATVELSLAGFAAAWRRLGALTPE